jgi:hypothetical protein
MQSIVKIQSRRKANAHDSKLRSLAGSRRAPIVAAIVSHSSDMKPRQLCAFSSRNAGKSRTAWSRLQMFNMHSSPQWLRAASALRAQNRPQFTYVTPQCLLDVLWTEKKQN